MPDCPFCNRESDYLFVADSASKKVCDWSSKPIAYAFYDNYPVTTGHMLIVPARHVTTFFDLNEAELTAINNLLQLLPKWFEHSFGNAERKVEGWNIGWNCGEVAGQSIMHAHCHLIPRRKGDHPNPRGGVRGVIPEKADY